MASESLIEQSAPMVELLPRFDKTVHTAFYEALDQGDYSQALDFFQGFAKGFSRPGISKSGLYGQTTATLIYQKLHTHRREIEQLSNYRAVQEFLITSGVKKDLVGSIKRIQKLCERLGLHLGKPGRPRKPEK